MSEQAKSRIEIQLELLHIYGSLATAAHNAGAGVARIGAWIDVGPLVGVAAYAASGQVYYVGSFAERYKVRKIAARVEEDNSCCGATKEVRDARIVIEASCRSVMKNCAKIRTAITGERMRSINPQPMETICATVLRLLTYETGALGSLKKTVPVQLLYILYCFDRVTRMTANESLARRFDALADSLVTLQKSKALYHPTVVSQALTEQAWLPKELVGLVVDYCRLGALSSEDEELIINRILESISVVVNLSMETCVHNRLAHSAAKMSESV